MRSTSFARSRHLLTSLTLVVVAAGCSNPTGVQRDLADARARWTSVAASSYEITISRSCFCGPDWVRPAILTVRGGQVVSARSADTGLPLPAAELLYQPTVDSLFAMIERAEAAHQPNIDATYDVTYGFPVQFFLDPYPDAVDDEVRYYVRDYHRL